MDYMTGIDSNGRIGWVASDSRLIWDMVGADMMGGGMSNIDHVKKSTLGLTFHPPLTINY
ncbi:hypothetical protein AG1IA_08008 [Rhizoctonia solani AG-1 IA]|uniref:Uncharacterized protein n=1 Tax=Thanatephorus cucumeris (strain AG1-IA) TaxID=983506 RepID=L8WIC5_THACA|nr:hypothetical protein AG1IA_08008 [Rhizoctonia solani AG-1 IA]